MPVKHLTTSRGLCRTCGHKWSVPKTKVSPDRIVKLPGRASYVMGLDLACPECASTHLSWIYDNQKDAPSRPTGG